MAPVQPDTGGPNQPKAVPPKQLRAVYSRLFHELQFRATKSALMNYHEAEKLQNQSGNLKITASIASAVSASGIVAGVVKKGQVLASRAGLAGFLTLPVCAFLQIMENSKSEALPSLSEKARKHVVAAAGWMRIAETAHTYRLRIAADSGFDLQRAAKEHETLIVEREKISQLVLIPRKTHQYYNSNPETVYLAMKKRQTLYKDFKELERQRKWPVSDVEEAEDLYF